MRLDKLGVGVGFGVGFGMIVGADGGDVVYRPGACTHCKKLKVRFFGFRSCCDYGVLIDFLFFSFKEYSNFKLKLLTK